MAEPSSIASERVAPSPTTSPEPRKLVYGTIGLVALLLAIYLPILRAMVHHWSVVEDYQHGFIVAPLAVWFAWERRDELSRARIAGSWLGLVPLAIGLLSLAIGRLGTELMTMRWGFVFTLIGLVLLVLGREVFRILAFPLFFLFLMVPLPQSVVNTISFPLQLIAAESAVRSLQELGIPALVEGNIIHLAHTQLFVHEACSGLRSLMALVTLGVVFAHFFQRGRIVLQILLVVSTIPIAIAVNAFRVGLTGYLTHYFGEDVASGAIHDFQGVITFGLAFVVLMGEARLIDWIRERRAAPETSESNPS